MNNASVFVCLAVGASVGVWTACADNRSNQDACVDARNSLEGRCDVELNEDDRTNEEFCDDSDETRDDTECYSDEETDCVGTWDCMAANMPCCMVNDDDSLDDCSIAELLLFVAICGSNPDQEE